MFNFTFPGTAFPSAVLQRVSHTIKQHAGLLAIFKGDSGQPIKIRAAHGHAPRVNPARNNAGLKRLDTGRGPRPVRLDPAELRNLNPAELLRAPTSTRGGSKRGVGLTNSRLLVGELRLRRMRAAIAALQAAECLDPARRDASMRALTREAEDVQARLRDPATRHALAGQTASNREIADLDTEKRRLVRAIAAAMPEGRSNSAKAQARAAQMLTAKVTETLNEEDWHRIDTTINHQGHAFRNSLVPAAELTLGNGHAIFPRDYQGKGVCSASTDNVDHATNLWTSKLSVPSRDGKSTTTLFEGIRHGVLSPYGLAPGSALRKQGARTRAMEVVTAALALQPERVEAALRSGEPLDLKLSSVSLLTPLDIGGASEATQLNDQCAAWRELSARKPLRLSIRDGNGALRDIAVNLDVATFNFAVNELALKTPMPYAQRRCDALNAAGLAQLFGKGNVAPDAPIGGWVGDYLERNPGNQRAVLELTRQIRAIYAMGLHRRDTNEPYALPQRVMRLTWLIGATPAYNCKSGKDRTGFADTAVKVGAIEAHCNQGKPTLFRSKVTREQRDLDWNVLSNSGNFEIQSYNTGVPGSKVMKKPFGGLAALRFLRHFSDAQFQQGAGLARAV